MNGRGNGAIHVPETSPSLGRPKRRGGAGRPVPRPDRFVGVRIAVVFVVLIAVVGYGFRTFLAEIAGLGPPQSETIIDAMSPVATVEPGATVTFTIKRGETTADVAERLASMGMVENARAFRLLVMLRGAEDRLRAGSFPIRSGMSMDELITVFAVAAVREVQVTFIEGRRFEEQAETLAQSATGVDASRFVALARQGNFMYEVLQNRPAGTSLEGYLFPDTYKVVPGETTAEVLMHMMLKRFSDVVTPSLLASARRATRIPDLTAHQLVTIASIVEREAAVPDERARIASVYLNRFRAGEGLFADPTVQYALGRPGEWWPFLVKAPRTLAPDSPYNTYLRNGLPPGPIANPGEASLRAVAAPDDSAFRYFVRNDLRNDGTHVFAVTLSEHEANRLRYQRG